jgi:hypothetical protein
MFFSINTSTFLLGIDTYRLKKDGSWQSQDDFKEFDDSDMLFGSYGSAEFWLKSHPTVSIDNKTVETKEPEAVFLLDFKRFSFEIILHRTHKPRNPIFTKEQVRDTLINGDDNFHNSLIIDFEGFPRLIPLYHETALALTEYAVRYETFDAGNGYVGPKSKLSHLDRTYLALLETWHTHLVCGRELSTDSLQNNKTEEQFIAEINEELSKLK